MRFVYCYYSAMSKRQTWLVLTALFTLLFIVLIAIGAHLISIESANNSAWPLFLALCRRVRPDLAWRCFYANRRVTR